MNAAQMNRVLNPNPILALPAPRKASKNFANKRITRRAWAIRKLAAASIGAKCSLIKWGPCVKQAMGRASRIVDCHNNELNGRYAKVTRYLLDEAAVVFSPESVIENTGLSRKDVSAMLEYLIKKGGVYRTHGFYSVVASARPYPQPLVA